MKRFMAGGAIVLSALLISACATVQEPVTEESAVVQVHYLEIVTTNVEETIGVLTKQHSVTFGEPQPGFGNARIADLASGGRLGVRAPLGSEEVPVVRPYMRVDDIEAAISAAQAAGGEFAMLATEIPGQGKFAIYFLGGIQHGLWEK